MFSPRHILGHSLLRRLRINLCVVALALTPCTLFLPPCLAQGGSPVQPEYTDPPVSAGPNVNQFTGDFTYGLPVLTVPGPYGSSYSLTLSYQAGTNPNSDVSWVGYGWSLNPGAIVRGKRGFPDDWDGEVIMHAKRPIDYTISNEISIKAEIGSHDLFSNSVLSRLQLTPGIEITRRYDSRTGFGDLLGLSAGFSFLGNYAGLQYLDENGDGSWSGIVSPNLLATAGYLLHKVPEANPRSYGIQPFSWNGLWRGSRYEMYSKITSTSGMPFTFDSREFHMSPPTTVAIEGVSRNSANNLAISFTPGIVLGGEIGSSRNILTVQPIPRQFFHGYGYMRSAEAQQGDTGIMDYYYEKDVPYSIGDKFLPIPFSNSDGFFVIGGGSFRLYNRNPGDFWQNALSSQIQVKNSENTIDVGALWGIGKRWGTGKMLYDARGWKNPNAPEYQSFTDEGDEPWFFRFSHDMGGSLLFDDNDSPIQARIIKHVEPLDNPVGSFRVNEVELFPLLPNDIRLQQEEWERPGRSGYIGFTLNKDMLLKKNNKYYKSYNRDSLERTVWVSDRGAMPNQIGEFALFESGKSRYVYGLPVYSRNEKILQLGLPNIKLDSAVNVKHNLIAYRYIDQGTASTAVGQEMNDPYAVAWLLTEITTPNYVDLTGDGPSNDDLGGWTKFHYQRITSVKSKTNDPSNRWIYWRNPFRGLAYQPGELSDPEDDLGGYSEGLKELYYLQKIETKTHIAVLVLNNPTTATRKDGYSPFSGYGARRLAGDSTATSALYTEDDDPVTNEFRYLDRIELYARGANGYPDSLLSTTHFAYDYSLRPNMPNSLAVAPDSTTRYGMLTLRKVWSESVNVRNNRIAPIIFGYDYRKSEDYSAAVQGRYPEITSYADGLTAEQENPPYNPYDFDAWGNYRPGGAGRLDQRFPYVPQNDTSTWDPAAWQLKWVKTSSGGEMHVQYEEDEYSFVQDRPAQAMVSLVETPGGGFFEQSQDLDVDNTYYLRLSDIGIDSTVYEDVAKVRELMLRQKAKEKKLFFKFFYALKGDDTQFDNPEYSSDYIEGYADVDTVVLAAFDTGTAQWYGLYVKLIGYESDGSTLHEHGLPKRVCWDFVHKNKRGKLGPEDGVVYSTKDYTMMNELHAKYYGFDQNNHCKDIDYARSYIRVPMITSKKGGGLRVKRLLSYDPGIQGDSALYGTEYHYEVYDQERNEVISSGVASNEPGVARDENPLVAYNAREEEDETKGKVMAGRDRARNEGPIGETLLPAAAIGYSRVATNPIHQGSTAVGFAVTDFYTSRDFPFDTRYDAIGNAVGYSSVRGEDFRTSPFFQNFLFFHQLEDIVYCTQGYRFILNDMNGKMRRSLSNGGVYTPLESNWTTGAMTEYQYYQPGDSVPLLYHVGDSIRYGYPGKVMEIVHASRKNGAYINDFKIEGDAGFWFFSGMLYYSINNSELFTDVITKVIDYPAIVKSVTTYADGHYDYVENLAFDPHSGAPLVTRTRDPFDGLKLDQSPSGHVGTYVGYSFPIVDIHPEFDQAAGNERAHIESTADCEIVKKKDGTGRPYLKFPGGSETRWLRKLTPGDLIELRVTSDTSDAGRYHVDLIDGKTVWLIPSYLYNAASDASLSVVDEVVNVDVIHSGRQNAPSESMGEVATYGETDTEISTGANFGWSGPGASARLSFVNQLNDSLLLGAGVFNGSNVDTTLEFELPITHSCGTLGSLGETFALRTSGGMTVDTIFVAYPSFSSPTYVDTIVDLGLGGWFALDDGGQIVFRSVGNLPTLHRWRSEPGAEQRIRNFTFCGDSLAYRSVAHVIGATASGRMTDTIDHDGGGVSSGTGVPNAYEKGERGRWYPKTGFAYKTDVTHGSRPVAGERVYKNAGVFDDFSLYNWREPESSDLTHWFDMGSVTGVNKHAVPFSAVDMLGHSSVTRFGYGSDGTLLPIVTAWNAEDSTVAFESFETYSDGSFEYAVTDAVAHSGLLSYDVSEGNFTIPLKATAHVLEKGLLVRFWMYPLWSSDVNIKLSHGGSPATYSVTSTHRIARAGEWGLYEYPIPPSALDTLYSEGDGFAIWFDKVGGGDTIRIDDIKVQPTDAVAAGSVFDKRTFRTVALFDDQDFGMYPQYDAEGKGIRTIVETSRGVKTIAESHFHISGANRDWLGEGAPFIPTTFEGGGGSSSSIYNGATDPTKPRGSGTGFDLLHLQMGFNGQQMTVFGVDPSKLRDLVQEKVGEMNALSPGEVQLLAQYKELNDRYLTLQKEQENATTEEAKAKIASELRELESQRDTLLNQLGITNAHQ